MCWYITGDLSCACPIFSPFMLQKKKQVDRMKVLYCHKVNYHFILLEVGNVRSMGMFSFTSVFTMCKLLKSCRMSRIPYKFTH